MRHSKEGAIKEFYEKYSILTDNDKENFSKVCRRLTNENYIYGQLQKDRNDYYLIKENQDIIECYFSFMDYDLGYDDTYQIFYIKSQHEHARIRFLKLPTILLLLCRKFYYTHSKSEIASSIDINISFDNLVEELNKTQIYKDKLVKTDLIESLKTLKRYKLIDFDVKFFSASNSFTIYPTILHAVTENDLSLIESKISSYKNVGEEVEENETYEN